MVDTPDSFVTLTGTAWLDVLSDGRARSSGADVTVVKPPWGSTPIVWLGGATSVTLSLTVYVATDAQMAALEARRCEVGTLTYPEYPSGATAVLTDVSSGDYWLAGEQKVRTSWILTG